MRYVVMLAVALMFGPVIEASAGASDPSIWFVTEGGQGPNGQEADSFRTQAALEAIRIGVHSGDPVIRGKALGSLGLMLDDLAGEQNRNGQQ